MPILPAEPDMYPESLWDEISRHHHSGRRWRCLHTKPRQEKAIARELRLARVPFYLPQVIREARTPSGRKTTTVLPLFTSYLFLFSDEVERLVALKGNRLAQILEIADQVELFSDLRQIHAMTHSGLAITAEPRVPVGSKIRIASGPLLGLIGTVYRRGKQDHFVASINILGQGAAVALEDWQVEVLHPCI